VSAAQDIFDSGILVLDDHPSNVLLLERILRVAGYRRVIGTTEPLDACAIYREGRIDLLLLDLQMPGMDGFQVMQALGASSADEHDGAPILALTAAEDPATRQRAIASGARDLLLKPYNRAELLDRVRRLLESRRSRRQIRDPNAAPGEQAR